MADIRIGTSGYSYRGWVGRFYPERTPSYKMLEYYVRKFSAVEINASYYAIPNQSTVRGWVQRTPKDFVLVLKAFKGITHLRQVETAARAFSAALEPLSASGKLGAVLLQLPKSFTPTKDNTGYFQSAVEALAPLPLVAEFRHPDWMTEANFQMLRRLGVALCCTDTPDVPGGMPRLAVSTAEIAYMRVHGRDPANPAAYNYPPEELEEIADRVRRLADQSERVFVFFNNDVGSHAPWNAAQLREMLELQGPGTSLAENDPPALCMYSELSTIVLKKEYRQC